MVLRWTNSQIIGRFLRITTLREPKIIERTVYIPLKEICEIRMIEPSLLKIKTHLDVYEIDYGDRKIFGDSVATILQCIEELPFCENQKLM